MDMSFNDFVFLASKCEEIHFCEVTVKYNDGSVVPLEKLIDILSNVKDFSYDLFDQNIITSNTVKELLEIPHFSLLDNFKLKNIPQVFDIKLFYDHIKKNKKTKISLSFCNQIPTTYKARLQNIVFEIIAAKKHKYLTPYISFPNNYYSCRCKLWNLYHKN